MKIFGLVLVTMVAGFFGLTLGLMLGDFGICGGAEVTVTFVLKVCVCGLGTVFVGAAFDRQLSWIPPLAFLIPLVVFGGLLPMLTLEWNRVLAAWLCIAITVGAYAATRQIPAPPPAAPNKENRPNAEPAEGGIS